MYKFECGCEVEIKNPELKEDGFPSLWIDYYNLPDCPRVWDLIGTGQTKGIFQLETNLGKAWAKRLMPTSVSEMAALISVLRPGSLKAMLDGKSITQHFIDRKHGLEEVEYFHEALEPILKETYQLLIYQEQAIRISQDIAGFTLSEGDTLRKCIAKGSLVYTQNGPRKIEDLVNTRCKPKILSVDDKNQLKYYKINKVWSNGLKNVYKIRTKNGYSIKLTENHQVFTQDGWKEVKDITIKDCVILPKVYNYKGYEDTNENRSILLAYFIGEGCYTEKSPSPKITNSDLWIIEKIKNIIDTEFGVDNYSIANNNRKVKDIYLKKEARKWIISICDKAKSRNKEIPSKILYATNSTTSAFIGSYFSAEGDVNVKSSHLCITSISRSIIDNLQVLLLRDEIYSDIIVKNSTYKEQPYQSYRLYISDRSCVAKFYNKYQKYICPDKLDKIKQILSSKYHSNYKPIIVPSCFIKSVAKTNNLNYILGNCSSGGSVYNSNLTYDKVSRLNMLIGSELLQNILDAEFCFVQIGSINNVGEEEVFDFELEEEPHAGFINGIFVHNSIGKKLPELMAQVKTMFLEGCQKTQIVTAEQAEEIFGWIEKSQRYSFNKSHAVSYGEIGRWTAWVKHHFPLHFFTSWLCYAKEKMDPQVEVRQLVSDAKHFDIEVCPPSILNLTQDFSFSQDKIRFGINNIKKVGVANAKKLMNLIEGIEDWTWFDFLRKLCKKGGVNSTTINGLIQVGALSHFGPRTRLLYEYDIWTHLTEKERRGLEDIDTLENALLLLYSKSTASRKSKIGELLKSLDNPPHSVQDTIYKISNWELDLLGVPLTYSKIDNCKGDMVSLANTTCKEAHGRDIWIAGEITKSTEYKVKKGANVGSMMGFLTLEDSTGSIDLVAFSDIWNEKRHILYEGNTVLLNCYEKGGFVVKNVKNM